MYEKQKYVNCRSQINSKIHNYTDKCLHWYFIAGKLHDNRNHRTNWV